MEGRRDPALPPWAEDGRGHKGSVDSVVVGQVDGQGPCQVF